jgi:hypothetical protein
LSGVVQFPKAGRRLRAQAGPDPLVTEIVDALHYLGGQAHRDAVINGIAAVRRNAGREPPADLASVLTDAFHNHLQRPSPGPCLLALPFGPESRRWGLSQDGLALMRHKMRMI